MKIKLIKPFALVTKMLKVGTEFEVLNAYGMELIEKGIGIDADKISLLKHKEKKVKKVIKKVKKELILTNNNRVLKPDTKNEK